MQVLCDRGGIAQRNLGGQIQGGSLGGFIPGQNEGVGREAAGAGLAHSDDHTQMHSGRRGGDDRAFVQHQGRAPGLSEPPQAPDVQAEAMQVQADPQGHDRDPGGGRGQVARYQSLARMPDPGVLGWKP